MPEEKAADGDIVEQVARAIENETDATWGLDRAARFAIAAVHAADRKAGKVLVDRSDVNAAAADLYVAGYRDIPDRFRAALEDKQ